MRIMVAGGGLFGQEHLKTLAAIGGTTVALAEPRDDVRERLSSVFGLADADADAFALLERYRPEGVVIATPAKVHAPLATAALEKAIPVLVEKPVAPDAATMRLLCAAADASSAFLLPGHILRFSSQHRRLREVLAGGRIGDPIQFNSRRFRDASHAARYTDIDPVLMTMIHDIDLALWFSDAPVARVASVFRRPAGTARSVTTACLQTASGTAWQLSTAWLHPGADCPPDRVEIIGTEGSAELFVGSHLEIYAATRDRIELDPDDDPLRTELECFLTAIRLRDRQLPVTPQNALDGITAAEAILAALST
jgi:predicted dehydrogenase